MFTKFDSNSQCDCYDYGIFFLMANCVASNFFSAGFCCFECLGTVCLVLDNLCELD